MKYYLLFAVLVNGRDILVKGDAEVSDPPICKDNHESCPHWESIGDCQKNPGLMLKKCEKSCNVCCGDSSDSCAYWASIGECEKNPAYMLANCKHSCDVCQIDCDALQSKGLCEINPAYMFKNCRSEACDFTGTINENVKLALGGRQETKDIWWVSSEEIRELEETSKDYLKHQVWGDKSKLAYAIQKKCRNNHKMCTYWALQGRCNEIDIKLACAPACQSCDYLNDDVRCGGSIDTIPNALNPGDVGRMFHRIITEFDDVTIHSQPTNESDAPWIVTFDNFFSDIEINQIMKYANKTGFEKSGEIFGTKLRSDEQRRTSSNSWCGFQMGDLCFEDPIVRGLLGRIANVTRTPVNNFNEVQVLRYLEGEFYREHGDYIIRDTNKRSGGRILTFFMYFSDVEEGGETGFPRLDPPIKITPKKGRALLWSNVLDDNPAQNEDIRIYHQALPVKAGIKHAANVWIHMRDVQRSFARRCFS